MSKEVRTEVAVVGAGPAGAAAAITLARKGLRVALLDRARFPREKCCGDGLTTGALRRLEALGLDPAMVPSFQVVDDLAVRSPSGRIVRLPLAQAGSGGRRAGVRGAVARRLHLDAALVQLARGAGAEVFEAAALEAVEPAGGSGGAAPGLRLVGGTRICARYVIGADGAWSPLRRLLESAAPAAGEGRGPLGTGRRSFRPARDWHAFRCYASGVGGEAAGQLWVWFPEPILPGYAWSFPLPGGRANVGICLESGKARGSELGGSWRELLDSPFLASLLGPGARLERGARSWPIPSGLRSESLTARGGRVLFAGDAAGAADPFTGEGIAQALETGMAAAEAIVRLGATSPEAVAADYLGRLERTLAVEHRLGRAARKVMSRPLGARGALFLAGVRPWTRRQVGRFLYEDYPRPLVLAPWRWRLGALAGDAPYGEVPGSSEEPGRLRAGSPRSAGPGR